MKASFESINPGASSFLARKFEERYFSSPYHFHPEFELTWILKGSGKRYVGTNMNDYLPGDLVLLGSNVPHCWKSDPAVESPSASIVLQFQKEFLGDHFFNTPEMEKILHLLNTSTHGIQFTADMTCCKAKMLQLAEERDAIKKLLLLLEILHVLSTADNLVLLNKVNSYTSLSVGEKERINVVFAYIVENFRDKVTLQEASAAANMTPPAFCKYFKKVTRKTFIEAVTDYRMSYAVKELVHSDKSIEQIGFESGFNDISNFYKTFKERQKISPLNYRNNFIKKLEH